MTYKLTTDLIADCMALIPDNLEILNTLNSDQETKIWFESPKHVQFIGYNIELDNDHIMNYVFLIDKLEAHLKFLVLSYCVKTIPEFQVKNSKVKSLEFENLNWSQKLTSTQTDYWWGYNAGRSQADLDNAQKTIASATLHGQGEYPPSTLEELCESYKNVMKQYGKN